MAQPLVNGAPPGESASLDSLLDRVQWRWVLVGGAIAFFGAAFVRKKLRQRNQRRRCKQTVHRGIICGECGDVIRGLRYMCANCMAQKKFTSGR